MDLLKRGAPDVIDVTPIDARLHISRSTNVIQILGVTTACSSAVFATSQETCRAILAGTT